MKYLCCRCEVYMEYASHEQLSEGSLGIFFSCPKCGNRIALITNPGETMLVHSLGVKIGSTPIEPQPLELTRTTLKGAETDKEAKALMWTAAAQQRMERIPPFARAMAKQAIERYALAQGYQEVSEAVINEYKEQADLADRKGPES